MTRVAIIGAGIAGLGAAHALHGKAEVTLFEAAPRPGGHAYTVDVGGVAADLGFLVFSRSSYPRFSALLDELGVASRSTAMSFSVAVPDDGGGDGVIEWASDSPGGWFAQARNLVRPRHWRFLAEIVAFLRVARADLGTDRARRATLDDYLRDRRVSADVRDRFVMPLAAALWSLAPDRCGAFPAETWLRFMHHHGMLRATRPHPWRTVVGGSRAYVRALLDRLGLVVETDARVERVDRDRRGVIVIAQGRERRFDRVIVATAAADALAVLDAPTDDERAVLGACRTSENRTVLHGDRAAMPRARRAWASWNYAGAADRSRVAVTYWLNRLMGLPAARDYFVTLNPRGPLAEVHHEATFRHPQLDLAAIAAQAALPRLQGPARTYFAGAWTGNGFHEDGLRSGAVAAARLLADEGA